MIIKIEYDDSAGIWRLTNRTHIDHTTQGSTDADHNNFEVLVCTSTFELQEMLDKWGYTPEDALKEPPRAADTFVINNGRGLFGL